MNFLTFIQGETIIIPIETDWNLTGYTVTSNLEDALGNFIGELAASVSTVSGKSTITLTYTGSTANFSTENNFYRFDVKLISTSWIVTKIPIVYITILPSITP